MSRADGAGGARVQMLWRGALVLLLALAVLGWHASLISSLYANLGDIELVNMALRPASSEKGPGGEKALISFRSALAWDGANGRAYVNLGHAYTSLGNYDAAVATQEEGIARGIQDPIAYYRLGEAYLKAGDIEQVRGSWRRVFGNSLNGSLGVANRLIAGGHIEQGIEELKLAAAFPGASDAMRINLYGRIAAIDALNWRAPAEAQFYAEQALSLTSGDGTLHRWLAWALYIQGQWKRAMSEANQAISLGDTAATTYEVLGRAALASGDVEQAISALEVSVSKGPGILWAQIELGQAYQRKGMRQEAIARFKRALEISPGVPQAREGLEQLGCKSSDC